MSLHTLIENGNGAARQRRHEREGGFPLLLRRLAEETLATETVPSPIRRFARRHDLPRTDNRHLARAAEATA